VTDRYDPNDPLAGIEPYDAIDDGGPSSGGGGDGGSPGPMPPRSPLLTGLVLGLMLVVVSIALFQLLGDDDTPGEAATTTTSAGVDTTATDGTGGTDTSGVDTTATDGTGVDDTSGNTGTGTGTPYDPVGDPIPVTELTMAVDGIGPITLGQPAPESIGRLVASFGTPDEDTGPQVSVGDWGVCEGDTERIVRWGPLAAIVVVDESGAETFAGYRLDLSLGGFSAPSADMATLSGLQVGTSFRDLERIYADFDVRQLEDPDLGRIWELRSTETGNLLLWGPLTDDDVVRGIYANDACGTF
jgi:hypothetical protein